MKRIAIIGAGWLGFPLAKHLQQLGHSVYASKTTKAGLEQLTQQGITGFICDLNNTNSLTEKLTHFQCDTVIGCFPPGFRRGQGDEYPTQWETLCQHAIEANVTKIVMFSSTTVYPERADSMVELDASFPLTQDSQEFSLNAIRMLQAEQSVIDSEIDYTIIRCSGLIGPNRHPARFAAKLKQVSHSAPANMLHLEDAIGIATFALNNLGYEVINATTPKTVSKAEFYQAALKNINSDALLPPVVDIKDKKIVSDKLVEAGYSFRYADTLDALKGCHG